MEKLGIIFDVSHLSAASFWDAIEITEKPIIASHSNCYSLQKHPRNLTNKQIEAIAEKDGVIGLNFWTNLLKMKKKNVQGLVDNVDYIKKLVGINYVGIGSDFDGIEDMVPQGLEDVTKLENLTKELANRNYTKKEIKKFLGLNYLRVFKKVWN